MNKPNILVALAWPYVNGDIHIGHLAGYLLPADIVARFYRTRGNTVLMVSGSDCYGTPITVEADKKGVTPAELVETYHPKTSKLFADLRISYDLYTSTITENHTVTTQKFFLELFNRGYITRGITKQYYSTVENRFLPDRYVEGTCPRCGAQGARSDQCDNCGAVLSEGELLNPISKTSGTVAELRETEHYFLEYGKFQGFLEDYLEKYGSKWRTWIVAETKKWLLEGLKPRAITRDLDWGVPLPVSAIPLEHQIKDIESKRLYVWFDAVIGYLSASIEWAEQAPQVRSWQDFWFNDNALHYYFMGKDNLVFHTLFWPAYLHGYNPQLHLPDIAAINQYLTFGGDKFSKSKGITADPRELADRFGLDSVRFYLATIMPESADADFNTNLFGEAVNGKLVAKIGNFINRTLTLARDTIFTESSIIEQEVVNTVYESSLNLIKYIENVQIRRYVEGLLILAEYANSYITEKQPWALKKANSPLYDEDKFQRVISSCMYLVVALGTFSSPLLLDGTDKLTLMLGLTDELNSWPDEITEYFKEILLKIKLGRIIPIFTRIETNIE
jgi:methionyl-tRNA synthetase